MSLAEISRYLLRDRRREFPPRARRKFSRWVEAILGQVEAACPVKIMAKQEMAGKAILESK
jgi:hypothetical protein